MSCLESPWAGCLSGGGFPAGDQGSSIGDDQHNYYSFHLLVMVPTDQQLVYQGESISNRKKLELYLEKMAHLRVSKWLPI